MDTLRTIVTTMANIEGLHLTGGRVVDGFLLPDVDGKLLPSLRRPRLEDLHEDGIEPLAVRRFQLLSRGVPSHL